MFVDNDSDPIGAINALEKYLSPMAEYLKLDPTVSIHVTLLTPVPKGGNMKNSNKPATQVHRERIEAIRKAMGKMGIRRERRADYEYGVTGISHPIINIKKK